MYLKGYGSTRANWRAESQEILEDDPREVGDSHFDWRHGEGKARPS